MGAGTRAVAPTARAAAPKQLNEANVTPLPKTQILALMLVQATEAINMSILFPFLPFMVEDLGYGGHKLGPATGLLAAAFCGAQVCSSLPWGWVSDRYGRKPSLLIGLVGSAAANIAFGMSTSFPAAFVGRFCAGLLNGNLAAVKSIMAQVTDASNRTRGFSTLSLAWGLGVMIAPMLGGLLSRPAERFPGTFPPGSVFAEYPYLLPCVGAVVITALAVAACLAWMREPLPHPRKPGNARRGRSGGGSYRPVRTAEDDAGDEEQGGGMAGGYICAATPDKGAAAPGKGAAALETAPHAGEELEMPRRRCGGASLSRCDTAATYVSDEDDEENTASAPERSEQSAEGVSALEREGASTAECEAGLAGITRGEEACLVGKEVGEEGAAATATGRNEEGAAGGGSICSPDVCVVVTGYTVLAMAHVLFDETLPLWCKLSAEQGGLGFEAPEIGLLLSTGGISLMAITAFIMPTMGRAGYLRMLRLGALWSVPLFALYPAQALLASTDDSPSRWLWPVLVFGGAWRNLVSTMAFTAIIVLLNHTVPPERLGVVNGIGQLFASAARTVGPALGGVMWSFFVRIGFVYANFVLSGILLLATYLLALITPARLERAWHD